ncbi:hypothetical protein T484DRAFT_1859296 [Baffinella frigidus]|nr:hypothetical protein T484DRAFT_1859296 [Cryptophyta sp. CCMP2293]
MAQHDLFEEVNAVLERMEEPDPAKFPLFEKVPFYECVGEAGESLYIPEGFWHYVRFLDNSFSVSFWWKSTFAAASGSHE